MKPRRNWQWNKTIQWLDDTKWCNDLMTQQRNQDNVKQTDHKNTQKTDATQKQMQQQMQHKNRCNEWPNKLPKTRQKDRTNRKNGERKECIQATASKKKVLSIPNKKGWQPYSYGNQMIADQNQYDRVSQMRTSWKRLCNELERCFWHWMDMNLKHVPFCHDLRSYSKHELDRFSANKLNVTVPAFLSCNDLVILVSDKEKFCKKL